MKIFLYKIDIDNINYILDYIYKKIKQNYGFIKDINQLKKIFEKIKNNYFINLNLNYENYNIAKINKNFDMIYSYIRRNNL